MRTLRGCAATAIAVTMAAAAHTLSGGGAPPAWLLIAATVLTAPLAVALIGATRSMIRLSTVVVLAQAVLHTAFAGVGTARPAVGGTLTSAGHDHAHLLLSAAGSADMRMTCGHALAAIVTIALLATGERMLAAIARGIRRLLRLPAPSSQTPSVPACAPSGIRAPLRAAFLTAVSRRGPPAFAR